MIATGTCFRAATTPEKSTRPNGRFSPERRIDLIARECNADSVVDCLDNEPGLFCRSGRGAAKLRIERHLH
jgi:hypothetical protein